MSIIISAVRAGGSGNGAGFADGMDSGAVNAMITIVQSMSANDWIRGRGEV